MKDRQGATVMLYKVLNEDGTPYHGGKAKWHLPSGRPGKWMPPIKDIEPCARGYHVVTIEQLPHWIGPALFEVEVRGERIDREDKSVVSEARLIRRVTTWNERTLRLLACDFAEHVLPIFEKKNPNDVRPREAIAVARRFANGKATPEELRAAYAAAYDAAYAASDAADAAYAAAYAASDAASDAAYAAYDAAYAAYAASDAAYAAYAASDAAYAAYDAAYAASDAAYAASAAASDAAHAAYAAATAAASYAAATAYAARAAAARKGEREWQAARLREVIAGELHG